MALCKTKMDILLRAEKHIFLRIFCEVKWRFANAFQWSFCHRLEQQQKNTFVNLHSLSRVFYSEPIADDDQHTTKCFVIQVNNGRQEARSIISKCIAFLIIIHGIISIFFFSFRFFVFTVELHRLRWVASSLHSAVCTMHMQQAWQHFANCLSTAIESTDCVLHAFVKSKNKIVKYIYCWCTQTSCSINVCARVQRTLNCVWCIEKNEPQTTLCQALR